MTKSTRVQRWGLLLILVSILFVLREWLKLPEWLWTTAIFACGLLWYILWPPNEASPGTKKSVLRVIAELLLLLALLSGIAIVGIGLTFWLERIFDLRPTYAVALIFGVAGLLLLIVSLLLPRGPALPDAEAATNGEKSSLVQTLIDRIKQL
jgi:hypothetical protein